MIRLGYLQAGGGSTRFGRDKALVRLAGKSMLQRTGELLASVCSETSIVAPPGKYVDSQWPVIADRWPGEGPLGGILTALHHVHHSAQAHDSQSSGHGRDSLWALNLSCDMPFLTAEFLTFLWDRVSQSKAQVVVPQSTSGLEPLCACWSAGSVAAIQAVFDTGIRKVTEAMKRLPMEVLDESVWKRFDSHGRLFWNMNTPQDYEEARRIFETGNR
jgi:molybdenum cofactor guanylyltransferase